MWRISREHIKLENEIWSRETGEKVVIWLKNYIILNIAEEEVAKMRHPWVMAMRPGLIGLCAPGTKHEAWPTVGAEKIFYLIVELPQFDSLSSQKVIKWEILLF